MKGVSVEKFKKEFIEIIKGFESSLAPAIDSDYKGDDVDICNSERERNIKYKLEGRNLLYIKKVKSALNRIEQGSFGECMECGESISSERLDARPTAHMCIYCKEEQELMEGKTARRVGHPSNKKSSNFINVKKLRKKSTEYETAV